MAGGAGRIIDGGGDPGGRKARVIGGRLQVDSGGGGGGGVVTQGTVPWIVQEPLSVDDNGSSLTVDGNVDIGNFPAVQDVQDQDLKDEGVVAANPGRPILVVRDDDPALPAGVADGDFTFLRVASDGVLWVREKTMETILSGSTSGQPIQLTGVNSAGAVTLHNPGAGNTDRLWLYATNTQNVNQSVTIEFGGTGAGNEIDLAIGSNDTVLICAGAAIEGNVNVRGYAQVANAINVFGFARRVS